MIRKTMATREQMSITEQIMYSTVRIECEGADNGIYTGTGYFFLFKYDGESSIPVVITNKHVVEGMKKGTLIFTISKDKEPDDTKHISICFEGFESLWKKHPDQTVDLCAMPLAPIKYAAKEQGIDIFYIPFSFSAIPGEEELNSLVAMEEIVMIGYPNGIWDKTNNKPIFRKGITATHPCFDYNGRKEFMIDAACFPGSSGSPVLILKENPWREKDGRINIGGVKFFLMGTLYAGPQYTSAGEIFIEKIPTVNKPIVLTNIPNNLGFVIKSERIKELELLF
jgi:V8-like Glu-specific endopeptidase